MASQKDYLRGTLNLLSIHVCSWKDSLTISCLDHPKNTGRHALIELLQRGF